MNKKNTRKIETYSSHDEFSFFFETNRFDSENCRSLYFTRPIKILRMDSAADIDRFFAELEEYSQNYYLAGFFSYELGYLLEPACNMQEFTSDFPFALFGVYESPAEYYYSGNCPEGTAFDLPLPSGQYIINNLRMSISESEYRKCIAQIKEHLLQGDIYQVNYTIKYLFVFSGDPYALYCDLKNRQYVSYNVFGRFDEYSILSLSPELFFKKQGNSITVRPMKGTFARGRTLEEDIKNLKFLAGDEKNRSENLMIVDLMRNDLTRICNPCSVKTVSLFDIEQYKTLFQMTSTVTGELSVDGSFRSLTQALFPSGSITGAPKISSMKIIRQLEHDERKIYTGALGFIEPGGNATFNVAIRTILIKDGKGEMGAGGGIVYDSTPEDEYNELQLKAEFLVKKPHPEFFLIETLLYDGSFHNLERHILRMKESAEYFDYAFDSGELMGHLDNIQPQLTAQRYRVRVLLGRFGDISATPSEIDYQPGSLQVMLSSKTTDSNDNFYFHKTTNRVLYERELAAAREMGFFDVLFLNKKGELTEGSITNVYLEINGIVYTPPVECGLLGGTMRAKLIDEGKVKEKLLLIKDLTKARKVYISNAIIGFREAELTI